MKRLSRRQLVAACGALGVGVLSGCGSTGETASPSGENTPSGIRDFRIRADRDIVSTHALGIKRDRVATHTGIPRGAAMRVEFEVTPDAQIELTGMKGVVYTDNGIEVDRWQRDMSGALEPPQTRLHTLVGVHVDPGQYLVELRPQGRVDGGASEELAQARTELIVVDSSRAHGFELPSVDLDSDGIVEPHIGRPYAFEDVLSSGVAAYRTRLYDALNPGRDTTALPAPLADLIGEARLRPVGVATERELKPIQTAIPISISQTDTQTYTVRWENRPDESGVGTRYDRAIVAIRMPRTATVVDPGDADYVVSEPTQTSLVWVTRAPVTGIPVKSEESGSENTLWQQSFRLRVNPDPPLGPYATPTPTPTATQTQTPTPTATPEGTPTPTPLPTTEMEVHVSLQVGPLAERTQTPISYDEPVSGSIAAGGARYVDAQYQESPSSGIWATLSSQMVSTEVTPEPVETWNRGQWPSAGGGGQRARVQSGRTGAGVVNDQWQTTVGDPDRLDYTRAINTEPVIAAGLVFVGSNTGSIYGIEALTGEIRWQSQLRDRVRVSPAYDSGVVYAGSDAGEVVALTAEDGVTQWQTEIGAAISGDVLLGAETVYLSDARGRLHALDQETGEPRWQRRVSTGMTSTPTLLANSVIVGSRDGTVAAVAASDGRRRWERRFESGIEAAPTAMSNRIIVGTRGGTVAAVNAAGERLWEQTVDQSIRAPIAALEESLFIPATKQIEALTPQRGERRWSRELDGAVLGGSTVANRTLYIGTREGALIGFDTWSGRERFRQSLGATVGFSAPAVVDGVCVIGTVDGTVHGFIKQ